MKDEKRNGVPEIISGLVNPQSYPTATQWVAQGVAFIKRGTDTTTEECNHLGQSL
jgi:hypothetical protein